mmetsp:Transcript_54626/g.119606  ORF Transcript_54626/g.119606 Transcript_54626/m.119606 type:complete len:337 (+) Transcript_54626:50-1060(+)
MAGSKGSRLSQPKALPKKTQALRSLLLIAAIASWSAESTRIVTMEGDALLSLSNAAGKHAAARAANLKIASTSKAGAGAATRRAATAAAAAATEAAEPTDTEAPLIEHSSTQADRKRDSTSQHRSLSSAHNSSEQGSAAAIAAATTLKDSPSLVDLGWGILHKALPGFASVSVMLSSFAQVKEPNAQPPSHSPSPNVLKALETEFRGQSAEESCYRELSNYAVGCKASCRCSWSQQCYPHRIPFKNDDGDVEDVDVGLCSISVALAVFTSFGILVLVIGSIVATRMGLQWNLDEERLQHIKVVKKAKSVKFGGVSSVPAKEPAWSEEVTSPTAAAT